MRLAQSGDRDAFAELLQRRQAWIRSLMRRCCGDAALAEDLAQQVFIQAWRALRQLQKPGRFGAWLKRLAINTWLQHIRRNDPLRDADVHLETHAAAADTTPIAMDLDTALATLRTDVRICIVLAYHEQMTHAEIADYIDLPVGTVKSHIRRGTKKLRQTLSAYDQPCEVTS